MITAITSYLLSKSEQEVNFLCLIVLAMSFGEDIAFISFLYRH